MNYLLDTNVISEPLKLRPDSSVLGWLATAVMAVTVLTMVVTW